MAAFIKRVEGGQYALDRNSVIVVDEVGQLGTLTAGWGFSATASGIPSKP